MPLYRSNTSIKKDSTIIGLSMLVYMLSLNSLTLLLYGLLALLSRFGPGGVPTGLAYQLADIFGYVSALLLTVLLMSRGEEWNYKKPKKPFMLMAIPVFFASFFAVNFLNGFLSSIFDSIGIHGVTSALSVPKDGIRLVLFVLQYAVLPAVLEELLFRGALLGRLQKYGDAFALLFSSAVFALMHHDLSVFPGIFLMGLIFGYMAIKSDSLFPSMLMHFLNNFVAVASYYLVQHVNERSNQIFTLSLLGLAIVSVAIIIFLYFSKYRHERFNVGMRSDRKSHPGGRPFSGILKNGWMITFWVVAIALTLALEFLPRILRMFGGDAG